MSKSDDKCALGHYMNKPFAEYVKNLSSEPFTEEELNLLDKGLNYTIRPEKTNIDNIIIDIETAIKYKPDFIKHSVRNEVMPILKATKRNNNYQRNEEHNTLKSIKEKDVFFLKADKGNALVILDKSDYKHRMEQTIQSSEFQQLKRNPLPKMIKAATNAIKEIYETFKVPRWRLSVSNPRVPRLYGLPKIHKEGNKMRPIVTNINAPTYNIAKWLVETFNKFPQPPGFQVKNNIQFVENIKNLRIEEDELLISFDVVSLYPNVPISTALEAIKNWLNNLDITPEEAELYAKLTSKCMEQNEFQYDNNFYKLKHGTSMGHPLSCFVANAFMGHLETEMHKNNQLPKVWHRYVDDVFTIMRREEVQPFLKLINSQYESIKFTVEFEQNNHLPFLDLLLTRFKHHIDISVYRKPTTTRRYITSDSYCSFNTKMASFRSMINRMCNLPLSAENYTKELEYIRETADINGYNSHIINNMVEKHMKKQKRESLSTMFKIQKDENIKRISFTFAPPLTNTLKHLFKKHKLELTFANNNKLLHKLGSVKDSIPELQKSGCYRIDCAEKDCNKLYIGQTKRNITTRFKEHTAHFKYNRPEKSSVAAHMLENEHFDIKDVKLIKQIQNAASLDAWESLYIHRNRQNVMNTDTAPINSILFNI